MPQDKKARAKKKNKRTKFSAIIFLFFQAVPNNLRLTARHIMPSKE